MTKEITIRLHEQLEPLAKYIRGIKKFDIILLLCSEHGQRFILLALIFRNDSIGRLEVKLSNHLQSHH